MLFIKKCLMTEFEMLLIRVRVSSSSNNNSNNIISSIRISSSINALAITALILH